MIRRPPRSTLFPTRRSSDLTREVVIQAEAGRRRGALGQRIPLGTGLVGHVRSEEHTSELQSRRDLVCRLLLEKKNTPDAPTPSRTISHSPTTGARPTTCATC